MAIDNQTDTNSVSTASSTRSDYDANASLAEFVAEESDAPEATTAKSNPQALIP